MRYGGGFYSHEGISSFVEPLEKITCFFVSIITGCWPFRRQGRTDGCRSNRSNPCHWNCPRLPIGRISGTPTSGSPSPKSCRSLRTKVPVVRHRNAECHHLCVLREQMVTAQLFWILQPTRDHCHIDGAHHFDHPDASCKSVFPSTPGLWAPPPGLSLRHSPPVLRSVFNASSMSPTCLTWQ